MEDNKIIDLYFARSERAIAETSKKYGAYLGVIANNVLHRQEDAEEIVNDVYLAVWNSIPPNRPIVFKHYLSRIVRNLAFKRYSYLTAEKRSPEMELLLSELDECIPDTHKNTEELVEAKELSKSINRFLTTLSRENCGLFVSRYFYAQTIDQLAQKYGSSPRQIKYRLEKLRFCFRVYLRKEGIQI